MSAVRDGYIPVCMRLSICSTQSPPGRKLMNSFCVTESDVSQKYIYFFVLMSEGGGGKWQKLRGLSGGFWLCDAHKIPWVLFPTPKPYTATIHIFYSYVDCVVSGF